MADSTAPEAVRSSPQIDASRMHWPSSLISASSCSTPPRGSPERSRASASPPGAPSSTRTDALPARLVAEEGGDAHQSRGRSTVSPKTSTTPEPSVAPASCMPSNVSGTSSLSGPRNHRPRRPSCHRPAALDLLAPRPRARARGEGSPRKAPRRCRAAGRSPRRRAACPRRALRPDLASGRSRAEHHIEHVDERLDVVDDGGLPKRPTSTGKGRLLRGSPASPRSTRRWPSPRRDVGAGPSADLDVEREALAHHGVAQEPAPTGLGEGVLEHRRASGHRPGCRRTSLAAGRVRATVIASTTANGSPSSRACP